MRQRSQRRAVARKLENPAGADPLRPVQWIALAAFSVTPLALLPGIFISHDVIPKFFLLTLAAAALLVLNSRWSAGVADLWERTAGRWFLTLVAAQIVSLVISTALSVQVPLSIGGTVWRRFGLIGQLAVLLIAVAITGLAAKRPAWIVSLARAVSLCGGLAAFYGILQYFGFDPFLDRKLYAIEYFGGVVRPPSTMGHALYFSAYLAPVVLIALAFGLPESNLLKWRRSSISWPQVSRRWRLCSRQPAAQRSPKSRAPGISSGECGHGFPIGETLRSVSESSCSRLRDLSLRPLAPICGPARGNGPATSVGPGSRCGRRCRA